MDPFHKLSPGKKAPEVVNVIIEIPRDSMNKYEIDEETGLIWLDRVLPSPFHYPTDYGYIPQTLCEDGDAIDVMVLTHKPTFPGCVMKVRPIAVLKMKDEKGPDDKILAVPLKDPRYEDMRGINNVPKHFLKEIAHFYIRYKELEKGKFAEVKDWLGKKEAHEFIKNGIKAYKEELKKKI